MQRMRHGCHGLALRHKGIGCVQQLCPRFTLKQQAFVHPLRAAVDVVAYTGDPSSSRLQDTISVSVCRSTRTAKVQRIVKRRGRPTRAVVILNEIKSERGFKARDGVC